MATVPSESVGPRIRQLCWACAWEFREVLGGVLAPSLAGKAADMSTLAAPLWIMLGFAVAAGILAFGLRETAPTSAGPPA